MLLEWDEAKRRLNLTKHSLDFAEAVEVFRDPAVVIFRSQQTVAEVRQVAVGVVRQKCIVVVFTRRGETCRIISVRAASRRERRIYEEARA